MSRSSAGSICFASFRALAFAALASAAASGAAAQPVGISQPTGVVELFTSQGCSSCPPADRVMTELSKSQDTLALSWHVDYWDYLGWKDTFGSPESTKRQRAYAIGLGSRSVYTPQAVINGRLDIVGSRGKAVADALDAMAGTPEGLSASAIRAEAERGVLTITVPQGPKSAGSTLWMVYFDHGSTVAVTRGENKGREIVYSNVVRSMEMIGMVGDKPLVAEFRLEDMGRRGYDSCALILQKKTAEGAPGPIVSALVIGDLPR